MPTSQIETEFSAEQYHSSYPDGGELHWWPLARNRILRHVIDHDVPGDSAILEVGCGRGIVVKALREAGMDCSGVEPADVVPMPGIENFVRGGTHAAELPEEVRGHISTILLLDVIEHLPDAARFLREIDDAFPKLQQLIITVPARQELWSNYDDYFGHHRRYTRESLLADADLPGWEVRRVSYFFHSLYAPAWLVTKLRGARATQLVPPRGLMQIAHRIVAGGMFLDYFALPGWLPGSSLIASFRRKT